MERLYVIIVHWAVAPNTAKLEAALSPVGTWLRFSNGSWLLWSTRNVHEIYAAIAPQLTTNDSEVIMRIDENDWRGWGQPWIGKWIDSRGKSAT